MISLTANFMLLKVYPFSRIIIKLLFTICKLHGVYMCIFAQCI